MARQQPAADRGGAARGARPRSFTAIPVRNGFHAGRAAAAADAAASRGGFTAAIGGAPCARIEIARRGRRLARLPRPHGARASFEPRRALLRGDPARGAAYVGWIGRPRVWG